MLIQHLESLLIVWALSSSVLCGCNSIIYFPVDSVTPSSTPTLSTAAVAPGPTPEFEGFQECPQGSDQLLSECLRHILDKARGMYGKGVPGFGLDPSPYDPLPLNDFTVPVTRNLQYIWKNVVVRGLSIKTGTDVAVYTRKYTVDFSVTYPLLQVTADYVLEYEGKNLDGHVARKAQLDFIDWEDNGTFFLQITPDDGGVPKLRIRDVVMSTTIGNVRSHFPQLASSNLWGQLVENFMSSNFKWIYEVFMHPTVRKRLDKSIVEDWNKILPLFIDATYFMNK